jgi:hypothetical protein
VMNNLLRLSVVEIKVDNTSIYFPEGEYSAITNSMELR